MIKCQREENTGTIASADPRTATQRNFLNKQLVPSHDVWLARTHRHKPDCSNVQIFYAFDAINLMVLCSNYCFCYFYVSRPFSQYARFSTAHEWKASEFKWNVAMHLASFFRLNFKFITLKLGLPFFMSVLEILFLSYFYVRWSVFICCVAANWKN